MSLQNFNRDYPSGRNMSTFLLLLKSMMRKNNTNYLKKNMAPELGSFRIFTSMECL